MYNSIDKNDIHRKMKQIFLIDKLKREKLILNSYPIIPHLTERVIKLIIQINNPKIEEFQINKKSSELKKSYYLHKSRIDFNIPFDSENLRYYNPYLKIWYKGVYEREHKALRNIALYKHINKRFLYLDIKPIQILKLLYAKHKISKFLFKKSIKLLANNQKLPNKVLRLINCYLSTIKSNTAKTSITAIEHKKDRRLRLKFNNHKVVLKKKSYIRIFNLEYTHFLINPDNKNDFRIFRLNKIYNEIGLELEHKIEQDNKIVFDVSQHKTQKKFYI